MIAGRIGWRSSGGVVAFALACFALGLAVAFVIQWAGDDGEARDARSQATIVALEQRVRDLEAELRRNPAQRLQPRPSNQSLGEPVKVQTTLVGPDGTPKADR